jgi:hypothetical protein
MGQKYAQLYSPRLNEGTDGGNGTSKHLVSYPWTIPRLRTFPAMRLEPDHGDAAKTTLPLLSARVSSSHNGTGEAYIVLADQPTAC